MRKFLENNINKTDNLIVKKLEKVDSKKSIKEIDSQINIIFKPKSRKEKKETKEKINKRELLFKSFNQNIEKKPEKKTLSTFEFKRSKIKVLVNEGYLTENSEEQNKDKTKIKEDTNNYISINSKDLSAQSNENIEIEQLEDTRENLIKSFYNFLEDDKKDEKKGNINLFRGGRKKKGEKVDNPDKIIHDEFGADNLKTKLETFFRKDILSYFNKICKKFELTQMSMIKKSILKNFYNMKLIDFISNQSNTNNDNIEIFNNILKKMKLYSSKISNYPFLIKSFTQSNMCQILFNYFFHKDSFNFCIFDENDNFSVSLSGIDIFIHNQKNSDFFSIRLNELIKKTLKKWEKKHFL